MQKNNLNGKKARKYEILINYLDSRGIETHFYKRYLGKQRLKSSKKKQKHLIFEPQL